MKRFITFTTFFFFSISTLSAQQAVPLSTASAAYCPYTFTRDLKTGSTGADVKVLQQILNSDQRTAIAASGIASPGQETTSYGTATREAVKKFQALFIEYIGVANGVFGPKTRTVMNAVCNGEYYTNGKGQVYSGVSTQNTVNNNVGIVSTSTATTSDTVAPQIYLRSNSTAIAQGVSFRIIVTASEPIQSFTPESIIIEGGSVSDIRKLSPNSYSLLVTPNEGVKAVIAQVEADRVYDLAGNKNDNASNEIRISISQTTTTVATTSAATITSGITSGELDSIFNRILAQVTPATTSTIAQNTTCSNGATNPPYCNNQYNQPNYNNSSNNGQNQTNSLMNMLLLSKLLGGNGSNNGGGLFSGLFGDNKKTQTQGTGGQINNTSGSGNGGNSTADIQACANGDKTKCTPNNTNTSGQTGGEEIPNGAKIVDETSCKMIYKDGKPALDPLKYRFYLVEPKTTGGSTQKKVIIYASVNYQQDSDKIVGKEYKTNKENLEKGNYECCLEARMTGAGTPTCVRKRDYSPIKDFYLIKNKLDVSTDNQSQEIGSNQQQSPNQTSNAYNDPNSLTPANENQSQQPSVVTELTPQQCADKANSLYDSYNGKGYLSNAINAVRSQFTECGYGRIQQNFWGTKAIPVN